LHGGAGSTAVVVTRLRNALDGDDDKSQAAAT
jgi:hypothetical protein